MPLIRIMRFIEKNNRVNVAWVTHLSTIIKKMIHVLKIGAQVIKH